MLIVPLLVIVPVQYIISPFGPPYPSSLLQAVNVTPSFIIRFPFTFNTTVFLASSLSVATSVSLFPNSYILSDNVAPSTLFIPSNTKS